MGRLIPSLMQGSQSLHGEPIGKPEIFLHSGSSCSGTWAECIGLAFPLNLFGCEMRSIDDCATSLFLRGLGLALCQSNQSVMLSVLEVRTHTYTLADTFTLGNFEIREFVKFHFIRKQKDLFL